MTAAWCAAVPVHGLDFQPYTCEQSNPTSSRFQREAWAICGLPALETEADLGRGSVDGFGIKLRSSTRFEADGIYQRDLVIPRFVPMYPALAPATGILEPAPGCPGRQWTATSPKMQGPQGLHALAAEIPHGHRDPFGWAGPRFSLACPGVIGLAPPPRLDIH